MTTRLNIQTLYARNDGIVLELKMRQKYVADRSLRYFNCMLFSIFPQDNERLFICPPTECYLAINSIYNMTTTEDYKLYIHAISKLDQILNGIDISQELTSR